VVVDIAPEFKLPKYKKISLKREPVEVADSEVDSTFDNLMERFSRYEDVSDQPAASGDMVQVDYTAESDGKPLAEIAGDSGGLASGEDFWIPLMDDNEFVPGVNAALAGASIGDEIKLDVEFPEDYHQKAVAGRKALYHFKVKQIRKKVPPEINEEFLKQFDVTSEEELRERIRKDLVEAAEARENSRLKDEISKFLVEKTKMDVPQTLVESETYKLAQETCQRASRNGASDEAIKEHHAEIYKSASETALHRVKLSYVVNAICGEEGIEVTDEDVENQLAVIGMRYGMNAEQVRAELEKQDEGLRNLEMDILGNKVMDFLLENAKMK
jgi:trigger factor